MRYWFVLCLVVTQVTLFAQFSCHNEGAEEYALQLKHNKTAFNSYYRSLPLCERGGVTFPANSIPVKIHILQDAPGNGRSIDSAGIENLINRLNLDFAATGFQFYKCGSINYITNVAYNDLNFGTEFTPLYNSSAVTNVINIYFVRDLMFGGSPAAGVAPTPGGRDYILMRGNSALAHITHEAGHYFGLLHTHGVSNTERSKEKVDGSNCNEEGDFFCDTPADPNLLNIVSANCIYNGTWGDANGQAYTPDVANHMSYALAGCRTRFSDEQIAFMNWAYHEYRNYLQCSNLNINFTYTAAQVCDSPFTVTFTNTSVGLNNFQWDLNEDNVTDYTTTNATHTFSSPGIKYVHLKSTLGGKVYHRHKKVELFKSKSVPSVENFNEQMLKDGWRILDMDGGRSWELAKAIGPDGQYSNMLQFRNYAYISATAEDHVYSAAYNLNGLQNARLTFDLAYAPSNTTDTLKIYVSTNCGKTYDNLIFYAWGDSLKSTPKCYYEFQPTSKTWKTVTVNLSSYVGNYIRFKIENVNTGSNTISIDNFRIDGGTGIKNIGFTTSRVAFYEGDASSTEGCRKYTIVQVPLHASVVPSAPVTVTVAATGNAKPVHDYLLLDSVVIFPASSIATKYVRVKIYDDDAVEATETIVMQITGITGDSFTTSPTSSSCAVSISDNEPQLMETAVIDTVLLYDDFNNETTYLPARWKVESDCPTCYQGVYDSIIFWCTTGGAGGWLNMTESLDSTDYLIMWALDAYKGVPLGEYLITNSINATDYDSITLSFDNVFARYPSLGFEKIGVQVWDGNQWVSVWSHIEYNGDLGRFYQPYRKTIDISAYANDSLKVRFSFTDADYGYYWALDNVEIRAWRTGYKLATGLNSTTTAYFGPYDTIYISNNHTAIAKLVNESAWNYGCTSVNIDRAGTGAIPYELPDAQYQVTEKTIHITPANNNLNGQYSITLYYTQNEMNGWTTATGNQPYDMTIVKTGGAIKNITPANPNANGPTNQYSNNQSLSAYSNTGWKLEGTFYTGFSGFGGGYPATSGLLPVEYRLPLTAENVSAKGNVLQWETGIEVNNDYFEIERSTNGVTFNSIGKIWGQGNSTTPQAYEYIDTTYELGTNYYRLKQIDYDGKSDFSNIAVVYNNPAEVDLIIYPNPASNSFTVLVTETVQLELTDVTGAHKYISTAIAGNNMQVFNATNLPDGVYLLRIWNGSTQTIKRIVIVK
jgi:hypothetical protein